MKKNIFNRVGLETPQTGKFGVEVEVEFESTTPYQLVKNWTVVGDGSLRGNAVEYVLTSPLSLEKATEAITNLYRYLGSRGVLCSGRAGIHVHLNVQEYTMERLINLLYIFYRLESILIPWCGEERVGNVFCISNRESSCFVNDLAFAIKKDSLPNGNSTGKYSALNVQPIYRFGSVEFRTLEFTRDVKKVLEWLGIIDKISVMSERPFQELSNRKNLWFTEIAPSSLENQKKFDDSYFTTLPIKAAHQEFFKWN